MTHALSQTPPINLVQFDVDSKLVAQQILAFGIGKWACRSEALQPLYLRCIELGRALDDRSTIWNIRHIYREYNQVADSLANEAVTLGSQDWTARV